MLNGTLFLFIEKFLKIFTFYFNNSINCIIFVVYKMREILTFKKLELL